LNLRVIASDGYIVFVRQWNQNNKLRQMKKETRFDDNVAPGTLPMLMRGAM